MAHASRHVDEDGAMRLRQQESRLADPAHPLEADDIELAQVRHETGYTAPDFDPPGDQRIEADAGLGARPAEQHEARVLDEHVAPNPPHTGGRAAEISAEVVGQ